MTKFRRTIAVFIIALFACQSVMAGLGEHWSLQSDGEAQHLASASHIADSSADHGQTVTPELVDGDCCHAQGHCHLLAFTGQVANVSLSNGLSIDSSHTHSYNSLHLNTLLRPPTTV